MFDVIANHAGDFRIDSVIVDKSNVPPESRVESAFYPQVLGSLLRQLLQDSTGLFSEIIVTTDRLPLNRKRRAIEKAVHETLASMLSAGLRYRVLHHDSKSCGTLQVADYCNWAIYRKWRDGDRRSYQLIESAIASENEIQLE